MEEVVERLTMMSDRFAVLKQVQEVTVYLFVIGFMMGLAFVIFGFYIGQIHKVSTFTKRLYLISFFALVVPRHDDTYTIHDEHLINWRSK